MDKVWVTNYGQGATYRSVLRSLELLGTDYIGLMLLHQAYNDYHAAWRDLERAHEEGLVRSIGVPNFDPVRLAGLNAFADAPAVVNQVETHVFWQQAPARRAMREMGVQHMSWGPFAEGANGFFANPLLKRIGDAHGKSAAQVALRYLLDLGVVAIPKSTHVDRMRQNIDVFDFSLTDGERAQIASLDGGRSLVWDHSDVEFIGPWLRTLAASLRK